MRPQRIQRRRTKGWRIPPGSVNVSRPTDWSNPFRVGDLITGLGGHGPIDITITQELAPVLFEALIVERGWENQIARELHGKDLVCWCRLDEPCHADVLLRLANS